MSARGGGRGGGRGGRGGARGGRMPAPAGLPWDVNNAVIPFEPQELYPKDYNPPPASAYPLSASEARAVRYLVNFRQDFHNSGLYTHKHLAPETLNAGNISDPVSKAYGLEQINARFGVKSKATVDPFLSVPMYSHKFKHEARTIPDLRDREFNHDLFPEELWPTLDGHDGPGGKHVGKKRKVLVEDEPLENDEEARRKRPETDEERRRRIEEAAQGKENEEDAAAAEEEIEEDEAEMTQEDDDFEDDEDGGDYNAEQYFDGGENDEFDDDGGEAGGDY